MNEPTVFRKADDFLMRAEGFSVLSHVIITYGRRVRRYGA